MAGEYFGDRPEEKLHEIRHAKKKRAAYLCRKLRCNKESVVLEIGSGMGFTSKYVAAAVKDLYCSDIFWYFSEFQRLVKRRGKVFINVQNASKIDTKALTLMAKFYREDRDSLNTLLCWNSIDAVVTIAANFGFKLASRGRLWGLYQGAAVDLLFRKR